MTSLFDSSGNVIRTDGTRTGAFVWQNARDAGVNILAADHDTHDQGLADSIEACLHRGGQNQPTSNLNWGGFKITNLGDATASTDAVNVATLQNNGFMQGTTSGSLTAYTLSFSPNITSLVDGMVFWVRFHVTNGASPTLNIAGTGSLLIKGEDGVRIPPAEITGGQFRPVLYDNTGPQFRILDSGITVKPGSINAFGGSSAPDGWLLCDGSAISRTDYSRLFNEIGTTHGGGDGSTTFNLPDVRGRVTAGKDDMGGTAASRLTSGSASGLDGTTLGAVGGAQAHALTLSQTPAHDHGLGAGTPVLNNAVGGNGGLTGGGSDRLAQAFQSQGNGTAHTNVQPTIVLNYIIKA